MLTRALLSMLSVAALAPGCGCGAPPQQAASPSPPVRVAAPPRRQPARLAPRLDLHCTPADPDDEGRCRARGASYRFGPMPFNNGPARPSREQLEREEASYQAEHERGTLPCVCLPAGPLIFQSPR